MRPQIRERNGRFSAVVEITQDGKRKLLSAGTHATHRAAELEGWKLVQRYESNPAKHAAIVGSLPLGDWLDEWINAVLPDTVKPSTIAAYRWRCGETGWLSPLRNYSLCDLNALVIKQWLSSLSVGQQSKRTALATLNAALNAAVEYGYLTINPGKGVNLRQSKAIKAQEVVAKRCKVWTQEESRLLLQAAAGRNVEPLVIIGMYTGARLGEICGMQWGDVEGLTNTLTIQRNMVSTQSGVMFTSPKDGETRRVKLPQHAMDRLLLLRPADAQDSDRVLPLHPHSARNALKALCKATGVAVLTPHSLRHTAASLALSAGVPVAAVSKMLGHANPKITLETYSHCMPDDETLASDTLGRLLSPSKPIQAEVPVQVSAVN